jgi:hypothetical protein
MARPPRWQCNVQIRALHLVLPLGMLSADIKVGHERWVAAAYLNLLARAAWSLLADALEHLESVEA